MHRKEFQLCRCLLRSSATSVLLLLILATAFPQDSLMTLRIPYWALQGPILSSFQGYAVGETVHESWPGGEACNLAHALFFGRTIEQLANPRHFF